MKLKPKNLETGNWNSEHSEYYIDNIPTGLRQLGYSDEIANSIKHTGWYTDEYQDSTMRGFILQLPSKNGQKKYMSGVKHSDWDGITLSSETFTHRIQAAFFADDMARYSAETEREYQAKEQAKIEIEELHNTMRENIEKYHNLKNGLRAAIIPQIIYDNTLYLMRELRESITLSVQHINTLKSDYSLTS